MTLEQLAEMHRSFITARDEFRTHHASKPKYFDHDNEDHVRWEIKSNKLVSLSVKADQVYRHACDEFFAKACPDLIQLLVDVDEYFDGMEDINGNGGPNMAMRCRSMIVAFVGPAPAKKQEAEQVNVP